MLFKLNFFSFDTDVSVMRIYILFFTEIRQMEKIFFPKGKRDTERERISF